MSNPHSFLSVPSLVHSPLVPLTYDLIAQGVERDTAFALFGWAVEKFAMGYCAEIASAVARSTSRDQYVEFRLPEGELVHAVFACSPQFTPSELRGHGIDIVGKRPLSAIQAELHDIMGDLVVHIGDMPPEPHPRDQGDLLSFLWHLPWFRPHLKGVERTESMVEAAMRLGFEPVSAVRPARP